MNEFGYDQEGAKARVDACLGPRAPGARSWPEDVWSRCHDAEASRRRIAECPARLAQVQKVGRTALVIAAVLGGGIAYAYKRKSPIAIAWGAGGAATGVWLGLELLNMRSPLSGGWQPSFAQHTEEILFGKCDAEGYPYKRTGSG
jgi:hypothetical protein